MPRNRRRCGCPRARARRRTRGSARRRPGCPGGATCAPGARSRAARRRLCAKNGARVSNSPSTSAVRMKMLARELRVERTVVHAPVRRTPAARRACRARPPPPARAIFSQCGLLAVALEQMRAQLLQPLRLDGGHRARVEPRGLDELRGDDPLARLLRARARVHPELDAARAGVVAVRLVLHADVAEQPGEQRAMDRRDSRRACPCSPLTSSSRARSTALRSCAWMSRHSRMRG